MYSGLFIKKTSDISIVISKLHWHARWNIGTVFLLARHCGRGSKYLKPLYMFAMLFIALYVDDTRRGELLVAVGCL